MNSRHRCMCCPQAKADQTPKFDNRIVTSRKNKILRPNKRKQKRKMI